MKREFSAGAVVVRRMRGRWWMAAIEPRGKPGVRALPKGLIEPGESPEAAALREAHEETGLAGVGLGKLGDVRYVYTWRGERIFKVVSFFLVRYRSGRAGEISREMSGEVAAVEWLPLEQPRRLSYGGEREIARRAFERVNRPV